jgi:hypothetical protein
MRQHVKVVGALHIGLGGLGLLIACLTFVILVGVGRLVDDTDAPNILNFIAVVVGVFLSVISIPSIIGGIGLLQGQEWARLVVLVLSGLHLFNIPVGTAVGIYSIWALVQPETVELFNREAQ